GDFVLEETVVHMGEHPDGGGVHHGIEMASRELIAREGLGSAHLSQGADAIGIAAYKGDPGARIRQGTGSSSGSAPVADDQNRTLVEFEQTGERSGDTGSIRVGATPLPGLPPHGIDGSDPASERVHRIQIANDLLLVRDRYTETG